VKQWLKRLVPDRAKMREYRHLRLFGGLLHDPNLWHINRRSASGAFAVGLFVMYLPPVGQVLMAAGGAIAFRVNLPISVALVWITNPFTIPPMYYLAYLVGTWILGTPVQPFEVHCWLQWRNWMHLLAPLTIGGLVCGSVCSASGYFAVQAIWRWSLIRQIRARRARYRVQTSRVSTPSSKRQT
jgi:uncharacterized protein (DUF2062 family)